MRKKLVIMTVLSCVVLFAGCGDKKEETEPTQTITDTVETPTEEKDKTQQIEGYQVMDGTDVPVKISFTLEEIQKGEAAYKILTEKNTNLAVPKDDEEYIIVTFKISYDEGGADEIYLAENHASLQSASLYFALSNGDSNAEDMTEYLPDSVYNLRIAKGDSAQGSVAFLHKKDSIEPLYFLGFNNSISFDVSK